MTQIIESAAGSMGPRNLWTWRHLSPAGTARWFRFVEFEARHGRRAQRPPANFYARRDVLAEARNVPNIWHDEGEQDMCEVYFEDAAGNAALYLGLDARASLAEADALTDLVSEPSGDGYGRQTITAATDWTVSQDSGDYQAASDTQTFTASGGAWGAVTKLFLCDVASGTAGLLLCSLALTASRTLQDGDSLQCDITVKISE